MLVKIYVSPWTKVVSPSTKFMFHLEQKLFHLEQKLFHLDQKLFHLEQLKVVSPWTKVVSPWTKAVSPWTKVVSPWTKAVSPWTKVVSTWTKAFYLVSTQILLLAVHWMHIIYIYPLKLTCMVMHLHLNKFIYNQHMQLTLVYTLIITTWFNECFQADVYKIRL